MSNRTDESLKTRQLRQRAEAVLDQASSKVTPPSLDPQWLLHELEVHQVELELQYEELHTSMTELQIARDKYFGLYDLAPVGYLTLDERGTILEANLTAATLFGMTKSALLGTSLTRFIARDHQDTFYLHRRQVFEEERVQTCDLQMQRADGSGFVAYLESRLVQEGYGQAPQCLTTLSDITARKQAQAAMQQQHDWLDVTLSSISDGVIATDTQGLITFMNREAERLTGWTAPEAMGCHLDDVFRIFHEHTRQPMEGPVRQTLRQGTVVGLVNHTVLQTREHQERLIATSAAPIYSRDGTLHGVVLVFRDMTASRQLELQILQAQKLQAIGTLAGGIAHEFNNILTAILGFAQLTQFEVPEGSQAWENVQQVLTAGRRAKDVVQRLLVFSRQTEIEQTVVHPHIPVKETLRLLRASLPATIALHQHCADDVGAVLADPTQLQQVVMNLCVNADQAMRETGGVLEVCLDRVEVDAALVATDAALHPGPYVRLTVRDTGPGMDPAIQDRIFEPFFTTKGVGEGTGMGLAIVHGIVTRHGGAITVESTGGHGTTFTVYLPRIDEEPPCALPSPEEALPQGHERIFFVDDEQSLALLGHGMLTRLGYQAEVFTSPQEALAAFGATPQSVDVVITDQTMPQMTGEALTHELRRLRPDLPVILCTGFSYVINAAQAQEIGIDAFLMKPVTIHDLAVTLQQVLTQRRGRST